MYGFLHAYIDFMHVTVQWGRFILTLFIRIFEVLGRFYRPSLPP